MTGRLVFTLATVMTGVATVAEELMPYTEKHIVIESNGEVVVYDPEMKTLNPREEDEMPYPYGYGGDNISMVISVDWVPVDGKYELKLNFIKGESQ